MKKYSLYALMLVLFSCNQVETNVVDSISDEQIIALQTQINTTLLGIQVSTQNLIKKYPSWNELKNNGSSTDVQTYQQLIESLNNPSSTAAIFEREMDTSQRNKFKIRYFELLSDNFKKPNNARENSCADDCWLESHEVWFDEFFFYQGNGCDMTCADFNATAISGYYYAGCVYGCGI